MSAISLRRGTTLLLYGVPHTLADIDARVGSVTLADADGVEVLMGIEDLIHHPDIESADPGEQGPRFSGLADIIDPEQREVAEERVAHILEAMTGYRSGDPDERLDYEPRPFYDPATTTVKERVAAKVVELNTPQHKRFGTSMSRTTIYDLHKRYQAGGLDAIVDMRLVKRRNGRHAITERCREAIDEVQEKVRTGSNITMTGRRREVFIYLEKTYGLEVAKAETPSRQTISRYLHDRYTPSEIGGSAKTRASATGKGVEGYINVNPTRPGELVVLDTNNLDVLLKGTDFEGALRGSVVLALDWYSRSVVGLTVVEQVESAIDVSRVINDISRPKAMRPDFPEEARWPFVGIPHTLVQPVGGTEPSGLPFVNPETLVPDHGMTYASHRAVGVAANLGVSVLPARKFTPKDKRVVERWFRSMNEMILQHLKGYRGSDVSKRGKNVDSEVEITAQQLEDILILWVILHWQTHVMDGVYPPNVQHGKWSPNALYLHGLEGTGIATRVVPTSDYYSTLDTTTGVLQSRGVKVRGLYYNLPQVAKLRDVVSSRGGRMRNKWIVRVDPRDARHVYLRDDDGNHHTLKWNGLTDTTPPFTTKDARALLRYCRENELVIDDDLQLLEVLVTHILPLAKPKTTKDGKPAAAASRADRNNTLMEQDQAHAGLNRPAEPDSPDADTPPAPPASVTEVPDAWTQSQRSARAARTAAARPGSVTPSRRLGGARANPYIDSDEETPNADAV